MSESHREPKAPTDRSCCGPAAASCHDESRTIAADLVCNSCGHAFELTTPLATFDESKRCPRCGSDRVRQTFASYLRNGPILDPKWGYRGERATYG